MDEISVRLSLPCRTRPGRGTAGRSDDGGRAATPFAARRGGGAGLSGGESGRCSGAGDGSVRGRDDSTGGQRGTGADIPSRTARFSAGGCLLARRRLGGRKRRGIGPVLPPPGPGSHCVVVSVDYPLAPEHPYPAAVLSAIAAITWASDRAKEWGGDRERLVVLGDSAGGNLAAVAVHHILEQDACRVARQILAYPGVSAEREGASGRFGDEWPLASSDRSWYIEQYLSGGRPDRDPDVAPLLAEASGMPPTTLLLGGCDPLAREGLLYASHLWDAGVSVDLHMFSGQIHGFLTFDENVLPRSREALGVVANAIRTT